MFSLLKCRRKRVSSMKIKNVQEVKSLDKETQKIISSDSSKSSKMKSLFTLGLEVKEISILLGVRYNFVYNVISNMIIVEGVEVETTKQESKKDLVRDLVTQGKSVKEIAIDLRTNYNYIYKIVKEIKEESEIKQLEKEA